MAERKKDTPAIDTGGGAYFGGNVTAGRDVVGRDQVNWQTQDQSGVAVADLLALLQEARALLPQAGLDPVAAQAIEGDIRLVESQAAAPKPSGSLIQGRLKGILELIEQGGKAGEALEKLASLVGRAAAAAAGLF